MIGLTVVGNPAATVMTSSPGRQPIARRAWRRQRRQRQQVGGRAGVAQQRVADADVRWRARARTGPRTARSSARSRATRRRDADSSAASKTRPETGTAVSPATNGLWRKRGAVVLGDLRQNRLSERVRDPWSHVHAQGLVDVKEASVPGDRFRQPALEGERRATSSAPRVPSSGRDELIGDLTGGAILGCPARGRAPHRALERRDHVADRLAATRR